MYCPKNLHHLGKISDVAENLIQSYDSFEDSLLFLLLKQSKNKSSSKMVSVTMIKFAYLLPEVEDPPPPPPELALMAQTRGCPLCNYPATKNSQICHRIRFNPSPPRKKFPQRIKDNSAQSLSDQLFLF